MHRRFNALAAIVGVVAVLVLGATTSASAAAGSSTLSSGEGLGPDQQLRSPSGAFTLIMQGDGNLVVYGPNGPTWSSRTQVAGTHLVLQGDGNVVAYAPSGTAVWDAGTHGRPGARLVVQDDGNLVVYAPDDVPLWATGSTGSPRDGTLQPGGSLVPGARLASRSGSYVLVMQTDGNAVVYGPAGAVWSSRTGTPGSRLVMQSDGNLVVYSPADSPLWHTRTGGNPGSRAVVQDDGNLVLYRTDGRPPWYATSPIPASADIGSSTQVVTVSASSATATTARLTAWSLQASGWSAVVGPTTAQVGSAGIGTASESSARTPLGTFSLTEAFGRLPNPGTSVPYRVVDRLDWWVSDVGSPLYNQPTRCSAGGCPFNENAGENLFAQGTVYDHAVVIDYNRSPVVRGAGSAFFLHITNGRPTAGCVAIDRTSLTSVLRWLSPAARPVIAIGIP